jgi:hypothetical protein
MKAGHSLVLLLSPWLPSSTRVLLVLLLLLVCWCCCVSAHALRTQRDATTRN